MGEKLVIHNYGHGGGGITLSWGSSALAVREAPAAADRRAAVVGAGIMGLTTARLLQDRGWTVTIYTKALPPHTTSNIAGGQWAPTSVFEESRATPSFQAQFKEAARLAHHSFQNLVGGGYGVRWIENYFLNSQHVAPRDNYYLRELPELFPSLAELAPDEHPFSVTVRVPIGHDAHRAECVPATDDGDIREAGGRSRFANFATDPSCWRSTSPSSSIARAWALPRCSATPNSRPSGPARVRAAGRTAGLPHDRRG
jgi:hypothetical protein